MIATEQTPADRLLDVRRILLEPSVVEHARGREILARFPDAERVEVASHWRIPGLHGNPGNAARWNQIKRESLVLGTLKSVRLRPNGRSSDFIAPSHANGCAMSCAYCYVPRRKGFANPITTFVNIEQILRATERHVLGQGPKPEPNQCDPHAWVYDIGENSDCSVDAAISDNVRDHVALFRRLPTAKASFATKEINRDMLGYDPQGRTRLRFSLMPQGLSRLLDVRTAPVADRIAAIDDFVAAGYEVHVNFSPVVVHDGWVQAWAELLDALADGIGPAARAQLKCEGRPRFRRRADATSGIAAGSSGSTSARSRTSSRAGCPPARSATPSEDPGSATARATAPARRAGRACAGCGSRRCG